MTLAEDNARLRRELRIAIAEREVAQKALGDIAAGLADDPAAYASEAHKQGMQVRRKIEGGTS